MGLIGHERSPSSWLADSTQHQDGRAATSQAD
jgi:hypothetical protein